MPGSVVQPVPVPAAKVEAEEKPKEEEDSNAEVFIAFARIFSGTLRPDSIIHVFSPKYDPLDTHCSKYVTTVPANQIKLFLMMGREIEPVDSVPAGNVFGIAGLEKHIMAAATLSSLPQCTPFRPMAFQSSPIVRVAVEPKNILKLKELVRGLKLLQQADPNVEVLVQESGEHVIVTAGELHLERCIRDLHDRFAPGVDLKVSAPIVSFRESLAPFGTMPSVHSMAHAPAPSTINSNASSSTNNNDEAAETEETEQKPKQHEFSVTASTANKLVSFTMRASALLNSLQFIFHCLKLNCLFVTVPLSSAAIALIDKNATLLKRLRTQQQHDPESGSFLQQFLAALTATPVSHGGALFRDLTVDRFFYFCL
jgi:translation elongation factor EF-G